MHIYNLQRLQFVYILPYDTLSPRMFGLEKHFVLVILFPSVEEDFALLLSVFAPVCGAECLPSCD